MSIHKRKIIFYNFFNLLIVFSFGMNGICQSLSGDYTIGGDSPDYSTIGAAIEDLIDHGVSEDVVFNIRNGIYEEKLTIPEITGTSESSRITFQSEFGHWDSVKVSYSSFTSAADNYVWLLDGADYIVFKDVSIINTNATYSTTLRITGDSNNNTFLNVKFDGVEGSNLYQNALIRLRAPCDFSGTTFEDCYFTDGSSSMLGEESAVADGLTVDNCIFDIGQISAINLQGISNSRIVNNMFRCVPFCHFSGQKAVTISTASGTHTIAYNKFNLEKGRAFFLLGTDEGVDSLFIVNNYIGVNESYVLNAAIVENVNNAYVLNNTLDVVSNGIEFESCENINVYNNVFKSSSKKSIIISECGTVNSDNNCFYGSFQYEGDDIDNLSEFQLLTGTNYASVYHSPLLMDYITDDYFLHNNGFLGDYPEDDIEGNLRGTLPDIGALEFNLPTLEVYLFGMGVSTAEVCPGYIPIQAQLVNMGTDDITSMSFDFYYNDELQSSHSWVGSISTGDTLITSVLDSIMIVSATEASMHLEVTSVNGGEDTHLENNVFRYENLKSALTGTYTIGNILSDYATLEDAILDLNNFGICGNVHFLLENGMYDNEFHLEHFYASSSSDTLFIASKHNNSALVMIESSGDYVFHIEGSNNVVFHDLTMQNMGSRSVILAERLVSLKIWNCDLIGTTASPTFHSDLNIKSRYRAVVKVFETPELVIEDCFIRNGSAGVHLEQVENSKVDNTVLTDFKVTGINAFMCDSVVVYQNQLRSSATSFISSAIRLDSLFVSGKIANNEIAVGFGTAFSLNNTSSAGINVQNNAAASSLHSIEIKQCNDVEFVHNSFHLYGFMGAIPQDVIDLTDVGGITFRNNLVENSGDGDFLNEFPSLSDFDYNGIYISSGNFSPMHSDFAAWQADGNGINSFDLDPNFYSDSLLHITESSVYAGSGDVFPLITKDLEGKSRVFPPDMGAYNIGRDTTDIALLSIVSPSSCDSLLGLIIDVTNNGPDTLIAFNIYYTLNGLLDSMKYTNLVLPGDTVKNILVDDIILDANEDYEIAVWSETEPWNLDPNLTNDTLNQNIVGPYMRGTYSVGGEDPNFVTLLEAVERLKVSGMCDDVTLALRRGVYNESIEITNIPGLNDANHLKIRSADFEPDSVIISDYIRIKNVENVSLTQLFFTGSSGNNIVFSDTCENILIEHNKFFMVSGFVGESSNIGFGGALTYRFVDISINNNQLQGGRNLYTYGPFSTFNNLNIENNHFLSSTHSILKISNVVDLVVRGNINMDAFHPSYPLFELKNISGEVDFSGNDFHGTRAEFDGMWGTADLPLSFNNNLWGGCKFDDCTYIDFLHNTISGSDNLSLELGASNTRLKFFNNIIHLDQNASSEMILIPEIYHSIPSIQCDRNVYYATPQFPFYFDRSSDLLFKSSGSDVYSFSDWQASTPYDSFSIWMDPQFIALKNLRLNQDNHSPLLSDSAFVFVTTDIDNESRSSVSPNYGADEYGPHANNSSVAAIVVVDDCSSEKEISVTLVNTGTENLESSLIHLTVNDSLIGPVTWTGDLAPEDSIDVYVVDLDVDRAELISWSSMPNGVTDPFTYFDSAQVLVKTYAGHYYVYGDEPDFPDLQTAIDSLERYGICDSVFLNLRTGNYEMNLEIPFIPGTSEEKWVTIQSEGMDSSLVSVEAESFPFTIVLDSAQFIHLRHLSIKRGDETSTRGCIELRNRTKNIEITHNLVEQLSSNTFGSVFKVGDPFDFSIENDIGAINIENNYFLTGKITNIEFHGSNHWLNPDDFTIYDITINNNRFISPTISSFSSSEECLDIGQFNGMKISNNSFFRGNHARAIFSSAFRDTLEISNNTIYSDHFWHSVHIQAEPDAASTQYLKMVNNEISENTEVGRAVFILNLGEGIIANNSLLSAPETTESLITLDNCDLDVVNNQLINLGSGTCFRVFESLNFFDYNNYFSSGNIGSIYGVGIPDIAFANSEFGLDSNSVFGNPNFLNDTTLLSTGTINIDQGKNLEIVSDDILGNPRGASFDIGAYEIDDFNLNLTILEIKAVPVSCGDSLQIFVDVKNSGLDEVNNFDIAVSGEGILPSALEWSGTLEHLDVVNDYYVMTSPAISLPATIEITVSEPNDTEDEYPSDNHLISGYNYADSIVYHSFEICQGDSVLIGAVYFKEEGIIIDTISSEALCDSIVQVSINHIEVNTDITYELGTLESLNDDVNYQWVDCDDSYAPLVGEVNQSFIPTVNGVYALIVEQSGCIDTSACYSVFDLGVQTDDFHKLRVYPNPVTDEVWIDFDLLQSDVSISLYSVDGKMLYNKRNEFIDKTVLKMNVIPGVYFLEVSNSVGNRRIIKLVKQ